MDAVHNLSDELALVCLFLAYLVRARISRGLQRSANILNSVGLLAVSVVILWQALERLANPVPIGGSLATTIALAAALGNWGVARVLRPWQTHSAAIRLAYIHTLVTRTYPFCQR
jgi:Co/Zn/Cd efflux system component